MDFGGPKTAKFRGRWTFSALGTVESTDAVGAGLVGAASRGRKTLVVARVLLTIRGTGSIRTGDTPRCVVHFAFTPWVY